MTADEHHINHMPTPGAVELTDRRLGPSIDDLITRVRALESEAARPIRSLEEVLDVKYCIDTARRLTEQELSILNHATQVREAGLRHARTGNQLTGQNFIRDARRILEQGSLGAEAFLLGESFQLAAEAFILYRCNKQDESRATLFNAMKECHCLHHRYGYDVAVRQTHLGRNIIRVVADGGDTQQALAIAEQLVSFIEGDIGSWPWPALAVDDEGWLSFDMKHALMDQVLAEIGRLTSPSWPRLSDVLESPTWHRLATPSAESSTFERAHCWLRARGFARREEWTEFLTPALGFFQTPPQRYGDAWRALSNDVLHAARSIGCHLSTSQ
jgi:hypothetical protein